MLKQACALMSSLQEVVRNQAEFAIHFSCFIKILKGSQQKLTLFFDMFYC